MSNSHLAQLHDEGYKITTRVCKSVLCASREVGRGVALKCVLCLLHSLAGHMLSFPKHAHALHWSEKWITRFRDT